MTRHNIILAVYLILEKDGKILLYHRSENSRYKPNEFGLVAGNVEENESCIQAIIREANEEVDIVICENDLELVSTLHRQENNEESIDLFYKTTNWKGEINNNEPEKCKKLAWYSIFELPINTIDYIKKILMETTTDKKYSDLGFSKKLKVALANPPFSKLVYGEEYSIKSITPCIGLFYLESYCRDLAEIKVFEGEFYESNDDLINAMNNWGADVIGVTTNSSTYPLCKEVAQKSTAKHKLVGGPYSSFRIEESLVDYDIVFIGDAEIGLRDFLLGKPLNEIRGIAYKENGIIKKTAIELIRNLDEIPFPDHSQMQIGLYQASPHREMKNPFATMMTTRGCGFSCSFCLSANGGLNGGKYRERSVGNIIEEIEILTSKYGVKSIQFWDDTFTMRKERTKQFTEEVKKFNITYVCNTRTDKMDDEIAEMLFDSGCRGVFFGVESGDEHILANNIDKGVRNEQVVKAIKSCRKYNLQSTASFIFGSIDDTEETIRESINFALTLDADFVLFNIYTPHPGTSGYNRAINEGIIDHFEIDHSKYKDEPAGIPTICKNLSRTELHILKAEAYIEYYTQRDKVKYESIIQTYKDEVTKLKLIIEK